METDYSHTSVANWCRRGMTPKWPVPELSAQAIGERLGRPVGLAEIGMSDARAPNANTGLDFPRDPADAVRVATSFWSPVNRRDFLTTGASGFAVSAFTTPVTRRLVAPADENDPRAASRALAASETLLGTGGEETAATSPRGSTSITTPGCPPMPPWSSAT
jgi:hypothetical protein